MKKLFTLSLVTLITFNISAQAPQKMSYQAVIRDASNNLAKNLPVGMQISILQGSLTGTPVYVETQTPTTNINGLVTIEIGGGTPVTGTIAGIDWSAGSYFIKTETDPTGGTNYTISGTSQLLSVPYAMYAKTANTHFVGELYGGGIVFYVYDSGQHGLIAATSDQNNGVTIRWYASSSIYTNTMAFENGVGAGKTNTALIIASQGFGDGETYAARICSEYSVTVGGVTYSDWYLPSSFELNLLYLQRIVVGGFANDFYWSSTEYNTNNALFQYFPNAFQSYNPKFWAYYVRAIRSF